MAIGINNITIVGNLTRDPELRFTPNGTPVVSFAIAVNKRVQNKSTGEWENDADFFNVSAWFKLAENCAESLTKGDRVLITGRLSQNNWDDKDGQKRSAFRRLRKIQELTQVLQFQKKNQLTKILISVMMTYHSKQIYFKISKTDFIF